MVGEHQGLNQFFKNRNLLINHIGYLHYDNRRLGLVTVSTMIGAFHGQRASIIMVILVFAKPRFGQDCHDADDLGPSQFLHFAREIVKTPWSQH
jgi:hypothetical protein